MARSIVVVSGLSQFILTPDIREYHDAFFHGVAHRNGEWTPYETKGMDAGTPEIPMLHVWSNQYYVPHYCLPGSWPVVSASVRNALQDAPSVKFLPVLEERTIDYAWKIGEPIERDRYDMWRIELFESFEAVPPTKLGTRHELVTYRYKKVIGNYDTRNTVSLILGTEPSTETFEYHCCEAFLNDYPIHWLSGSMVFRKDYWSRIEPLIDKPFFSIREFDVSGRL